MPEDDLSRLERRLDAIEARQQHLDQAFQDMATKSAVAATVQNNIDKRLSRIEEQNTWLIRLIVGGFVMALLGFALNGGLTIG